MWKISLMISWDLFQIYFLYLMFNTLRIHDYTCHYNDAVTFIKLKRHKSTAKSYFVLSQIAAMYSFKKHSKYMTVPVIMIQSYNHQMKSNTNAAKKLLDFYWQLDVWHVMKSYSRWFVVSPIHHWVGIHTLVHVSLYYLNSSASCHRSP